MKIETGNNWIDIDIDGYRVGFVKAGGALIVDIWKRYSEFENEETNEYWYILEGYCTMSVFSDYWWFDDENM